MLSTGLSAEAETITEPIDRNIREETQNAVVTEDITDDLYITSLGSNNSAVYWKNKSENGSTATLNLKGNVTIEVPQGKNALYAEGFKFVYSNEGIINVNPEENKTVKIIGNVEVGDYGQINLNLNNADSYFAGKIETEGTGKVDLNLHNEATWYAPGLYLDFNDSNVQLDLAGGVLDLYHSAPDTTSRHNSDDSYRIFTIENYAGSTLNGATFRIKSDITKGRADKIVLSNTSENPLLLSGQETYYIQVAYDPSLTAGQVLKAAEGNAPTVLELQNITGDIKVEGREYEQDVNAGLSKMKVTPSIKGNEAGTEWKLTELNASEPRDDNGEPVQELSGAIKLENNVEYNSNSNNIDSPLNITDTNTVRDDKQAAVYCSANARNFNELNLKNDVTINVQEGAYALYAEGEAYGNSTINLTGDQVTIKGNIMAAGNGGDGHININPTGGQVTINGDITAEGDGNDYTTININENGSSTVKITGNIEMNKSGYISLNLNGSNSYLAGEIVITDLYSPDSGFTSTLKLNNGATWYVDDQTELNFNQDSLVLNFSGGVLDLYHSAPGQTYRNGSDAAVYSLLRRSTSDGTRELNISGYTGGALDGATFRIKSDIANGTADKIVLNGEANNFNSEKYYVQVAYDPSLTTKQILNA
ncbi:MAG: hypothetical protein ACI3ZR_04925, partial [bacterium]